MRGRRNRESDARNPKEAGLINSSVDADGIALLRLEHGKVQALDAEFLDEIAAALDAVERSPAHAVILTGTGGSFSAGVDLFRVVEGGAAYATRFVPLLESVLRRLFIFPRPVIAALNGHAIAGGMLLACACDRRIMAAGRGRVGVPELRVGVPFPVLGFEILRFAVGTRNTQALAYSGETYDAETALRRGFVDELVPAETLLDRARAVALDLASIPPTAFAPTKRQLRAPRLDVAQRQDAAHVIATWSAPASVAAIRAYLDRTLGKK
jgi:enoyl-CoA hydratase